VHRLCSEAVSSAISPLGLGGAAGFAAGVAMALACGHCTEAPLQGVRSRAIGPKICAAVGEAITLELCKLSNDAPRSLLIALGEPATRASSQRQSPRLDEKRPHFKHLATNRTCALAGKRGRNACQGLLRSKHQMRANSVAGWWQAGSSIGYPHCLGAARVVERA
jgi:hypothetical protein